MKKKTEANPNELNQDDARYGFRCCHLKNIWTAPLPPETELSRQMTTSTTSIDIMGLQAAYANLHTDQERDYFMQRYHDVISSFGGKTSYDFFFQAEDGIRDKLVTGVQTCALPIYAPARARGFGRAGGRARRVGSPHRPPAGRGRSGRALGARRPARTRTAPPAPRADPQIGRASCRERG